MSRLRLTCQRGQASAELLGMLWWILLAALGVWQILLAAWAVNQASNAARTGSRIVARDGDPEKAARNALTPSLREGVEVDVNGEKVTVRVRVPILVPGFTTKKVRATRTAELPNT